MKEKEKAGGGEEGEEGKTTVKAHNFSWRPHYWKICIHSSSTLKEPYARSMMGGLSPNLGLVGKREREERNSKGRKGAGEKVEERERNERR